MKDFMYNGKIQKELNATTETEKERLVALLRDKRLEKEISQEKMADYINVERKTISRTENHQVCTLTTFVKMATYLGYEIILKEKE